MLRFLRTLGCRTVGSVGGAPESKRTFPDQQPERDAFRQRMKELMIHRREEWPCEYEYWESAGRL